MTPAGSAVHSITFGSTGLDVGSGCRPPFAGQLASWSPPRTNTRIEPSADSVTCVNSWPSSSVNRVTCRGTKPGPSATQTLRTPPTIRTQAIRSAARALVSSLTNGNDMASLSENSCAPAPAASSNTATTAAPTARHALMLHLHASCPANCHLPAILRQTAG